jgi:hypothetical protein
MQCSADLSEVAAAFLAGIHTGQRSDSVVEGCDIFCKGWLAQAMPGVKAETT